MSKILLAEDAQMLRVLYKMDLEQDGHEVVTARTAIEALDLLERESPQRVVVDLAVPGMNGLEPVMRMLDRAPKIPNVLIASHSASANDFRTRTADALVMKSSNTGEIRAKIGELLKMPQGGRVRHFSKCPSDRRR
jgi:DNA-binding response OmpR family regulator